MASALTSFMGNFGATGAILGEVLVRLGVDNGPLTKGLAQAQQQAQTTGNQMEAAAKQTGNAWKTYAVAGLVSAGAALALFAAKGVMVASDLNESYNKVRNVFGSAQDSVLSFAQESANALGQTKGEALDAAASFGAMLTAMGTTKDEAADMSVTLVKLASDMGSFYNSDPSEMLERLRSGLSGEMEALRRYGIVLSAARIEQYAYAEGIAATGAELTDAQKLQARYGLILQDSKVAADDFAETVGDSLPNQLRVLRATVTDTAGELGQHLLPTLLDIISTINDLLVVVRPVLQYVDEAAKIFAIWALVTKALPGLLNLTSMGLIRMSTGSAAANAALRGLTTTTGALRGALGGLLGIGLGVAFMEWTALADTFSISLDRLAEKSGITFETLKLFDDSMTKHFHTEVIDSWASSLRVAMGDFSALDDLIRGDTSWAGWWAGLDGMRDNVQGLTDQLRPYIAEWREAGVTQEEYTRILQEHASVLDGSQGSIDLFIELIGPEMAKAMLLARTETEKTRQETEDFASSLKGSLTALGMDFGNWKDSMTEAFKTARTEGPEAANAFVDQTLAAYEKFRSGIAESLDWMGESLEELADKQNLTADSLIRGLSRTRQEMQDFGDDLLKIEERGEELGIATETLTQQLIAMGPEGAKAANIIANAHEGKFRQITGIWNRGKSEAQVLGTQLTKAIVGPLEDIKTVLIQIAKKWGVEIDLKDDNALTQLQRIQSTLRDITGNHHVVVTQETIYTGSGRNRRESALGGVSIPMMASGGFISQGPVLVGEGSYPTRYGRGSELVLPLNDSTLHRLGRAISTAQSGSGGGGGTRISLNFNGPVYGERDFEAKVEKALSRALARQM